MADGRIAGVGRFDWEASSTISIAGQTVIPGLIDAHMHLESTLLAPGELARLIVPRGTTAVISDSHEIGNVLGVAGIDLLAKAAEGLPLDVFFMASSCVPATPLEDAGASIGPDRVRGLLGRPHVLGLAEMMDVAGVLAADPDVLAKLGSARRLGLAVDGHAPGLASRDLMAYASAGIGSDHESTTVEEALAKASLGMLVQVREGSPAQNLDALLPLLASGQVDESWCLVTDDIFPDDLRRSGHVDGLLRRVVAGGVRAEGRRPPCLARPRPALRASGPGGRRARLPGRPGRGRRPGRLRRPARTQGRPRRGPRGAIYRRNQPDRDRAGEHGQGRPDQRVGVPAPAGLGVLPGDPDRP